MILSRTIAALAPSATLHMSKKAKALESAGHTVFNFSVGEPDLPPPAELLGGIIGAAEAKDHVYSPVSGLPALKRSILQYTEHYQHLAGWESSNVLVSTGAKQTIYNALLATLEQGDEVIVPSPYWVSYPAMIELAKAQCITVSCLEQDGFKLTPDALRSALTLKTKWLLLNSPSNPTGAVYTADELKALGQVLADFPHVWVLSDDIYEALCYSAPLCPHLLHVCPELRNRVLVVNGISKSLAATGWRLGWGIGPSELIEGMEKLQSHSTSGACCLVQRAVAEALNTQGVTAYLTEHRGIFESRRNILIQELKTLPGMEKLLVPEGAFYIFAPCQGMLEHPKVQELGWKTDQDLANGLLEHVYVCTVPGSEFGLPGYLRFSYALALDAMESAMQELRHFFAHYSKSS
jgi:aspartate aminotransferase